MLSNQLDSTELVGTRMTKIKSKGSVPVRTAFPELSGPHNHIISYKSY